MKFKYLFFGLFINLALSSLNAQCTIKTAPYSEDFQSSAWAKPSGTNGAGDVDTCWSRTPIDNYFFRIGPQTNLFQSGAQFDHTRGNSTGKYIYSRPNGFSFANDTALLKSPEIDVSSLSNPWLKFWYHMFGAGIDKLEISVSNDGGKSYTLEKTLTGQQQNSLSASWKEQDIDLASYSNDTIIVKFETIRQGFSNTVLVCLDDFSVKEKPNCPKPSNLQVTNVTNNSVKLSFTSGGASNWLVEYGNPGFSRGSGTYASLSSNPATITGLSANQNYVFFLRDSCGTGDVSKWIGPVVVRTLCNPVFFVPFKEDFDGNNFGPRNFNDPDGKIGGCWRRFPESSNYVWMGSGNSQPFNTGPQNDHTGGGDYAFTDNLNSSQGDSAQLETPYIVTTNVDTAELSFWYFMYGSNIQSLSVYVRDYRGNYNMEWKVTGQQQTSGNDDWKQGIINLAAYADDTIQVKFVGRRTPGFASDIAIDDIDVVDAPTCFRPNKVSVNKTTSTTAEISWTSGGANNWLIEYGTSGYTRGNGTLVSVTNKPFTLTGLSSNTSYDFYVRDSCSAGDVSPWVGPFTFSTTCSPVTAPWSEDFEGSAFTVPTGFFNDGSLPSCYKREDDNTFKWIPGNNSTTAFNSGPSVDHTKGTSSGKFLLSARRFGSNPVNGLNTAITTVPIDLSPLSIPECTFWYHMFGANIDSLVLQVSNGGSWNREFSLSGQQQNAATDSWKKAIVNLSSYANDTIRLRFVSFRNNQFSQNVNASIDDLKIREQPTCPAPKNFRSTASTANSITLNWKSGGANNWQIEYGTSGFSQGNGTKVNVASKPFTVTGLNSSTAYDFYVRDSCAANDTSLWVGPLLVRTKCAPVSAPISENFDNTSTWDAPAQFNDTGSIDICWSRTNISDYFWTTGPAGFFNFQQTGPSADHTTGSGQYLYALISNFSGTSSGVMETYEIDLSPLDTPQLSFWYHMYGDRINALEVDVNNGSGYTQVWKKSGEQQNAETDPWKEAIIDLSSYKDDTIVLRFEAKRNGNFSRNAEIAIDDFNIKEKPSCPKPTSLQVNSKTDTSVTVGWTTGGSSNWLVGYQTGGSGLTIIPASSNPFTITGLSPSTGYTIFIKDSCGQGDVSDWSGPLKTSTKCGVLLAPYTESFDGARWDLITDSLDPCWSRSPSPQGFNYFWEPQSGGTGGFQSGPNQDASGSGNYLFTDNSTFQSAQADVSGPQIGIPANLLNPRLLFKYHMFGSDIDKLEVFINDGTGWGSSLLTINGEQQTSSSDAWRIDSVDLANFKGDTIRFRFRGANAAGGFRGDIAIDEINIKGNLTQPCDTPTTLGFSNITNTSAEVSWNTTNPGQTYLSYYSVSAGSGSQIILSNLSSPYTLTGLQPGTNYVVGVYDSCGAANFSPSVTDTLFTQPCDTVKADFSIDKRFKNVNLNGSLTQKADTLIWDYGDGTGDTAVQNPTQQYANPGTYTITLIAFNSCGDRDTVSKTISVCDSVDAGFSLSVVKDSISLKPNFLHPDLKYFWDFGDGSTSTVPLSNHTYTTKGIFTITLTVVTTCGDSIQTQQQVDICEDPVADFTYSILSPPPGGGIRIEFDASASQNANSYNWDFGDGSSGTGVNPTHSYVTPGLFYEVTLTVTNTCSSDKLSYKLVDRLSRDELDGRDSYELYPNPADDQITISWGRYTQPVQKVRIFNVSGALLRESVIPDNSRQSTQLNVEGLSNGYYQVQLLAGDKSHFKKLIVR